MATLAMGKKSTKATYTLVQHIVYVILAISQEKMIWINALGYIAYVQNPFTLRDMPFVQSP